MSDWYENAYGFGKNDASDANFDFDSHSNKSKYAQGTDPKYIVDFPLNENKGNGPISALIFCTHLGHNPDWYLWHIIICIFSMIYRG